MRAWLTDWLYGALLGTLAGCVVFGGRRQTWLITILLMGLAVAGMVFVFLFDPEAMRE